MHRFKMGYRVKSPVHTKRYTSFKGVDFSCDPTQVDASRSPDAVNVIADATGAPRKRPGWRMLRKLSDSPVRAIYRFEAGNVECFIVHCGGSLFRLDSDDAEAVEIISGLAGEKSTGFMHDNKLYILTGKEFIYVKNVNGNLTAQNVSAQGGAYPPVTSESTGTITHNGRNTMEQIEAIDFTPVELPNIVTRYRRNRYNFSWDMLFKNTGDTLVFYTDIRLALKTKSSDIRIHTPSGKIISGENLVKFSHTIDMAGATADFENTEVFDDGGKSEYGKHLRNLFRCMAINADKLKTALENRGESAESCNYISIEFPADYRTKPVSTEDAIAEKWDKYLNRISHCSIVGWFNGRLFAAGNPEFPNSDFFSQVGEPTYFTDVNYTEIGNDSSPIMGYLPVGDAMAIIKGDSLQLQDSSVYLRTAAWDSEEGYYFPVKGGITGVGCAGEGLCASFMDDGVFLSKDKGIMGVAVESLTGERVLRARSTRINRRLTAENLANAAITLWNGYLMIAVGGRIYLADSRQRSYVRNELGNYEYEWYLWDGIPAVCFCERAGELYFATADGRLCKLSCDLGEDDRRRYSDWHNGFAGEPTAIYARWSTPMDDDGCFSLEKNLLRRGCSVFLKGAARGDFKILVRTDREFNREILLAHRRRGELDFRFLDFLSFSFAGRMVSASTRKVKKYSALQIICESDGVGDDFALMGIEKRYTAGNLRANK